MDNLICVYHANCFDGMTSAMVVKKFYENTNIEFIPANYGDHNVWEILKNMYDKDIIMVDFSLPRPQLEQLYYQNPNLLVLDHHKTAQRDCEGLEFCKFDLNESGASLAWKQFFPGLDMPHLVRYIRDRDLWKFKLPYSKEINAFIQSYPITIESYEYLGKILEEVNFHQLAYAGESILRYIDNSVKRICDYAWMGEMDGALVPHVMNNGILHSEIGHELMERFSDALFTVSIFYDGKKRVYSLRSKGDFDVSEIAQKFGGGGHKNSAGFVVEETLMI